MGSVRMGAYTLTNAPANFQRYMEHCLGELRDEIAIPYLDDVIVLVNRLRNMLSMYEKYCADFDNRVLNSNRANVNCSEERFAFWCVLFQGTITELIPVE